MNLNDMHQHPKSYILKYSIPSIIAMLLTSLVTIVDGLFISNHVGKSALSALHLGLPMLYIFLGIGIMIGVGGVSLAGRALGEQHKERAINLFNQTYWTGMTLVFLLALTCSLFLLPVINWLIKDTTLQNYFIDYYRIMLIIYPFMMMNILCGMFIRAEGKPEIFMQITLIVNALNILLDYLFI
ncbi:MAG: MATE family efflux transporter, partial [Clostridia bacterium]|nr:MATE family efflux transporter [Clostridia bacterium]